MAEMRPLRRPLLVVALVFASACSLRNVACGRQSTTDNVNPAAEGMIAERAFGGSPDWIGVGFLGDSLTAGLGLMADQAYPSLIQEMFLAEGYPEVDVVNAGLSGDTTAGGLRRLEGVLDQGVHVLVVALGGNDALRGLTVTNTYQNLAAIIEQAQQRSVYVLLAGMLAPTNLGPDYQDAFREIFPQLAVEYRIPLVPFLLDGVVGVPGMTQPDGVHPSAEGARHIAEQLYPRIRDLVDQSLGSVVGSGQ